MEQFILYMQRMIYTMLLKQLNIFQQMIKLQNSNLMKKEIMEIQLKDYLLVVTMLKKQQHQMDIQMIKMYMISI